MYLILYIKEFYDYCLINLYFSFITVEGILCSQCNSKTDGVSCIDDPPAPTKCASEFSHCMTVYRFSHLGKSVPSLMYYTLYIIIVALLENATIGYSLESLCVCLCVCVCFCTITQKEIDLGTRNRNTL